MLMLEYLVNTYITYPKGHKKNDTAILYLSDIFGLPLINNLLFVPSALILEIHRLTRKIRLGDSLAEAGYFVVIPDLFNGEASEFSIPEQYTKS